MSLTSHFSYNLSFAKWTGLLVRIGFAALLLLTSFYCLLAYIPDTYFAFIQAPFQAWLPAFIRFHPLLFGLLAGAWSWSVLRDRPAGKTRRGVFTVIGFWGMLTLVLAWRQPFANLHNNSPSYLWAAATICLLLIVGGVEIAQYWSKVPWDKTPPETPGFADVARLGCWVALVYPAMAYLRYFLGGKPIELHREDLFFAGWSLLAHAALFVGLLALWRLAVIAASRSQRPGQINFLLNCLLAWLLAAMIFKRIVFAAIPYVSLETDIYSFLVALALVVLVAGLRLRQRWLRQPEEQAESHRQLRTRERTLLLVVFIAAVYTVPALIGVMDWNGLFEKLWTIASWAFVAAALFYAGKRPARAYSAALLIAMAAGSFTIYRIGIASQTYWPRLLRKPQLNLTEAQARYAYFDTSFEVVRQLLSIPHDIPCDDLCEFLKQQTNIPASVMVSPVEFKLVPQFKPATGALPNIFIIVADSLRQDYVSAYNPRIDFTPNLGRFAQESVVMRHAFTRYGGTTLAEPSIWTGSMLLHKHYVEPFYPLNSLEKMIHADGYQNYVSVDTVLRVLLSPQSPVVKLDDGLSNWSDLDLCNTTQELESKLDSRTDHRRPIFFFSQPQNVHGVAIGRHYKLRPPRRDYSPFPAAYASEIERLDGCFGRFISYLKQRQLYDNSIIVFTADHGESLGEVGHHMHAFGMHPEILRIPLIIHLPAAMRRQYVTDTEQVAFSIDITPTLYYLLGHSPIANSEEAGKPLFARSAAELASYRRNDYLVASSYGPIYGILADDAKGFFVADELDGIYQYFDLSRDPVGMKNIITPELQARYQPIMRQKVQHIADVNHFQYHAPTLLDWALR